jgi:hypothetical protein
MFISTLAHNRFHYNCCDHRSNAAKVEEVKVKSLANAQKRRQSRQVNDAMAAGNTSQQQKPLTNHVNQGYLKICSRNSSSNSSCKLD